MADNVKFYVGNEYQELPASSEYVKASCFVYDSDTKTMKASSDNSRVAGTKYYTHKDLPAATAANKGRVYFSVNEARGTGDIYYANGSTNIKMTGNAERAELADKATQLVSSPSIQTNLASTSSANFNGTSNITPGVTGTLGVGNGGTGATSLTAKGIVYASSASAMATTSAGSSGQVLTSGGGGNNNPTWTTATNANTASAIVKRDGSGNFSAGTITANLTGTASAANKVNSSLSIGGKTFDGSSNVSITLGDLGLTGAMRLIGVATVAVANGSATDPGINGYSTKTAGDVILVNKGTAAAPSYAEYVWTSSNKWEEFGNPSDYAAAADTKISTAISGLTYTSKNTGAYVSDISEANGIINPSFGNFSTPSVTITAGNGSEAPKVGITTDGGSSSSQALTIASTSVYGVTKLSSATNSTSATLAATPAAVKSAYDAATAAQTTANNAMPKSGGTFTGTVTFDNNSASFSKGLTSAGSISLTNDAKLSIQKGANSTFSKDENASIYTLGGISAAQQISAKSVRIDDNAATKGSGCEMIYNSTLKCLEFTFS